MKRLKHVALVALIALSAGFEGPAQAGAMSGEDLVSICEPARADPVYRLKRSECVGYIIGVADTFDCKNKALGFNWDSTTYNDQQKLVGTVMDWLHLHPNVLNYQASGLVASALAGKYPCPETVATK